MSYRQPKLRSDARGQACQHCGREDGTTVSAHANGASMGKGFGVKSSDAYTAWLCYTCHAWLDQGTGSDPTGLYQSDRASKWEMWARACLRTWEQRCKQGIVKFGE